MGMKFHPFTGNFDLTGSSDAAPFAGQVDAYTDLPLDSTAATNSRWLVKNNSGTWPFSSYKQAGIYIRVNTAGVSRDTDYQFVGTLPSVMNDNEFLVYDDADATKNLKFQLSGITTGQTRVITIPDKSGTLATTDAADLTTGTLADARLSSNVPLKDAANTFSANQTFSGTNNVMPNQTTAASGSSLMTRDLVDARVGDWPAGQTVSVWNNIVYTVGTTAGKRLRGTISLPNNTETKLFNATAFGIGRIGLSYYVYGDTAAVGRGSLIASARGNQGDTEINDTNNVAVFSNSTYWVAFGSAVTLTTGDTLTGNVTGATAKVWRQNTLNNTSVSDCWLYDVTGIFSSADTNVERNGTPTGVGISNSVWGASPAAGNVYFFYQTRDASGNIMPACFQRQGGARVLLFDIQAF
jgi:hypothetical protein